MCYCVISCYMLHCVVVQRILLYCILCYCIILYFTIWDHAILCCGITYDNVRYVICYNIVVCYSIVHSNITQHDIEKKLTCRTAYHVVLCYIKPCCAKYCTMHNNIILNCVSNSSECHIIPQFAKIFHKQLAQFSAIVHYISSYYIILH